MKLINRALLTLHSGKKDSLLALPEKDDHLGYLRSHIGSDDERGISMTSEQLTGYGSCRCGIFGQDHRRFSSEFYVSEQ
ncbi:hypothetical protein L5515_004052 [Caenorhabditis briggsae]|uniref:Uncharacterized protein n=1 Tax=Caenorhabditis briggsae TaxID=6238 RepID=A0AAE9JAH5_CAEBR|nr:hypothetical protein L5515_004052 [Caenorhabditis briggsae]